MKQSSAVSWKPTPAQIGIFSGALLLSLIYLVLILQSYLQGAGTSQKFSDEVEALTTIANIQRHAVLLFVQTQEWLDNPAIGKGEIEKQRAFLNSQIRVLRPLLTPQSEPQQKVDELVAALQEYDRLLENLGESPSAAAREAARPQLLALLKTMDETLIKPAYDAQERNFLLNFGDALQQQESARRLLLGSAILYIVVSFIGSGFFLRNERRAFVQRQAYLQTLEQEVAERTRALQTSAEISRRLSSLTSERELTVQVVEQLKSAFNYYHAHIYLLDEDGETLRMAGGTGEVGKTLLERGHSLPLGKGLVGRAAAIRQVVLVPETRSDPNWLPNPLLPETQAEIAVPILAGETVLGVLDVQNNAPNSLTAQDAELIQSIADQVAIALQNIRANARAREAAESLQRLVETSPVGIAVLDAESGVFLEANDNALAMFDVERSQMGKVGPVQLSPPTQPDGRDSAEKAAEEIRIALQTGAHVFEWLHRTAQGREFLAEIRLVRAVDARGRTVLNAILTDITERRRQEEQARRRAQQQEALNRITQSIQRAARVEEALQIAARELGHALGRKPTLVKLEPPVDAPHQAVTSETGKG